MNEVLMLKCNVLMIVFLYVVVFMEVMNKSVGKGKKVISIKGDKKV